MTDVIPYDFLMYFEIMHTNSRRNEMSATDLNLCICY